MGDVKNLRWRGSGDDKEADLVARLVVELVGDRGAAYRFEEVDRQRSIGMLLTMVVLVMEEKGDGDGVMEQW